MPTDAELIIELRAACEELDRRQRMITKLEQYVRGEPPVPKHVTHADLESEYRVLMKQARTNWPELIVKSVSQRLDVIGFRLGSKPLESEAWGYWQQNRMDARQRQIHDSTLTVGRAYAIVWADERGNPTITPDHASTTIVGYDRLTGTRTSAVRRWCEKKKWYANLYLPDAIYKFQGKGDVETTAAPDQWEPRDVPGEAWPIEHRLGVPVVEYAVNRRLIPAPYGTACGEFETHLSVIDRINTTTFAGLLAETYSSFPVRALIGEKIRYEPKLDRDGNPMTDEDGNKVMEPVQPMQIAANRLVQIENPQGKLSQLPEANLDNYIKHKESHIRHLAAVTETPAHYLLGEMVNLSADAIRAAEAGLISKTNGHMVDLGESHEEVARLALLAADPNREIPADSETRWRNAESRSLAERADAAVKLASINAPWQLIAEHVLGLTPQEIDRAEQQSASSVLGELLAAPEQMPALTNGNPAD